MAKFSEVVDINLADLPQAREALQEAEQAIAAAVAERNRWRDKADAAESVRDIFQRDLRRCEDALLATGARADAAEPERDRYRAALRAIYARASDTGGMPRVPSNSSQHVFDTLERLGIDPESL